VRVSVIVASHQADSITLRACLDSLIAQADASTEIIVVDSAKKSLTADYPHVIVIPADPLMLTPVFWQLGINAADTDTVIVALTIDHCIPSPNWIESIRAAFQEYPDLAGVGGALDAPHTGKATDWAIYFARYSAFLPPVENQIVDDIAGDNAAYRLSSIRRCGGGWLDGFWETIVHDCLQSNGETLRLDPAMTVQFAGGALLRDMAKLRFEHGKHYGSTRDGNRLIRILTSPAIPFVLLNRIFGRVRSKRRDWIGKFVTALPALMVLIGAWSLGELAGYLSQRKAETTA
jgi:hypothetical protein